MKKSVVFIINPKSGVLGKGVIPLAIDTCLDKRKFDYKIIYTEYAGHATLLANKAREEGVDLVVAVGGDGTVNEVGRALVNSNTAMGILPVGSGNGLARHLQLPLLNLRKCIEIINAFEVQDLDYGTINGHEFFCTCGMGFDAFVSDKFSRTKVRGPLAYAETIITSSNYVPETYEIEGREEKAFLVSCANASQYGNDVFIAPNASMSDGLLDVIIIEPFELVEAPAILFELFNKTLAQNNNVKSWQCKELRVKRSKPGVIHFDGEPVEAGTDIEVKVHERGIKMIVRK